MHPLDLPVHLLGSQIGSLSFSRQTDAAGDGRVAAIVPSQYDEGMNLGFPEMIFIFLLALVIFGPKKLPEIGRQIGRALNEFKRASNEFKAQIEHEINQIDLDNQRQEILPPSEPTRGTVAALPMTPEPPAGTEPQSEASPHNA